jgi:hypothetical protein
MLMPVVSKPARVAKVRTEDRARIEEQARELLQDIDPATKMPACLLRRPPEAEVEVGE